jgi:hypothetical protein
MSDTEDDRSAQDSAEPPDEVEVGELIEAEIARLVQHPREEAARLKQVAADGEQGSTPFIEIVLVARWIVPFVALIIGITLVVYFKA